MRQMRSTETSARFRLSNVLTNHAMNLVSNLGPSSPRTSSTSSCEAKEVAAPSATLQAEEKGEGGDSAEDEAFLHLLGSQDLALSEQGNLGFDCSPPSRVLCFGILRFGSVSSSGNRISVVVKEMAPELRLDRSGPTRERHSKVILSFHNVEMNNRWR